MHRTLPALALALALVVPAALAQPAPNANPNAFKKQALSPQCQKLRDDYLKAQQASKDARGGATTDDGARARGGNPDLKALRKEFQASCGDLPAEMTPRTGDDERPAPTGATAPTADPCNPTSKDKSLADAIERQRRCEQQRREAKAGAASAPTPAPTSPTKAASAKCTKLHGTLKDTLARKQACGTDQRCRKDADAAYEKQRLQYQLECGDLPADAKPRK